MKIDHIGYAVRNIDKALHYFENLGFKFETAINDVDRNIKISFGEKDGYRIELICPLDREKKSLVDLYLGKIGPTPYHFCYQSNNFEEDIK